jgi:predicted flap endonuclease-1-like 5' DNA nuclease
MNLQKLVEAIDAQVLAGDIIGAFDKFAADNCVTLSGPTDITNTKAQKLEALRWFFNNVATVNRIDRPALAIVGDNITDSQFVFEFTNRFGEPMTYSEVIRRTWKKDQLVEEYYLMGQTIENAAPSAAPAKKSVKTTTAKKEAVKTAPVAEKTAAAKPAAEKKPAAKTTAKAKADDLTLIEGIGPKIAELLVKDGIDTFAKLASSKPAAVKAILEAAGKRYQMHDPATWPQQAALARDGKSAELKALQEKLSAGRK